MTVPSEQVRTISQEMVNGTSGSDRYEFSDGGTTATKLIRRTTVGVLEARRTVAVHMAA